MKERIIVSLTSWEKRINNIPVVIDSILKQSLLPDIIVLNLAIEEVAPKRILQYLISHSVEINYVPNTKVYKKLIPTLQKYPHDCVICIDDDWIYPPTMIEEFVAIHNRFPNNPISGKKEVCGGIPMHCGCASLTKAEFFDDLSLIDGSVMGNCKSDDMVYSFFSAKSGHPYIWTENDYYLNMEPYNSQEAYTEDPFSEKNVDIESLDYLVGRFGKITNLFDGYIESPMVSRVLQAVLDQSVSRSYVDGMRAIRNTLSYRLGHMILSPFSYFFNRKKLKK